MKRTITRTADDIEADAASAVMDARASLRETLESLARSVANDIKRLDAGKAIEGGHGAAGARADERAAVLREREDARTALGSMRRAAGGGK